MMHFDKEKTNLSQSNQACDFSASKGKHLLTRRHFISKLSTVLVSPFILSSFAFAETDASNQERPSETWDSLKPDLYGDKVIENGADFMFMKAPLRAHDAAVVPIEMSVKHRLGARLTKLDLIVDENPAPVAAEFEVGPGLSPFEMTVRVRVNAYSNIRMIAHFEDGKLFNRAVFVKASGGCSAPAGKDAKMAEERRGQTKFRQFAQLSESVFKDLDPGKRSEMQVMIRHPNNSGLQMDQVTQLYIPAFFINDLTLKQGDELLFRMTAGISISEDPSFRFKYNSNGSDKIELIAEDTEGNRYSEEFQISA